MRELLGAHMLHRDMYPSIAYLSFKGWYFTFHRYTHDNLSQLLNIESCYALIDRYLLFIKVLEYLAVVAFDCNRDTVRFALDAIGHDIDDPRLRMLMTICTGSVAVSDLNRSTQTNALLDSYTRGDYHQVRGQSRARLDETPEHFEFYELYCSALIHMGQLPLAAVGRPSLRDELIEDVYNVMACTPRAPDALLRLEKAAYSFPDSTLGSQLFAFVALQRPQQDSINAVVLREVNASVVTPRLSQAFLTTERSQHFWTSLEETGGATLTTRLFQAQDTGDPSIAEVPEPRRLAYVGATQLRDGQHNAAIATYNCLKKQSRGNPLLERHAFKGLFEGYLSTGEIIPARDLLLDTYFARRELLASVSLSSVMAFYDELGGPQYSADFQWAVLQAICYEKDGSPADNKKLFVLQDAFVAAAGASRPSRVTPPSNKALMPCWVYFLRYVCVPEILDSSIDYASSDDLEEERIQLCQRLLALDSTNADAHSTEIRRLTQARAVRDSVHQVDSSKVYVDTAGITKSLDRVFYESFDRYRQWYRLEERLRYSIFTVDVKGRRVTRIADVVQLDAVVELFNALFSELRDRYISSNEYGLDSYLSLRIRHGTLAGQLRRLFEERRIITTFDTSTNTYQSNGYWMGRFAGLTDTARLDGRLAVFSKRIDDVIDDVKRNWIQIRSATRPEGLFDFEYDNAELASLYLQYCDIDELEDFIAVCIEELNARATRVLSGVRSAIRENLRNTLIEALNELETDVIRSLYGEHRSEFRACIGQCRTETQQELELIAGWFETVGDVAMPDYELHHVVATSVEMLRRTSPETTARPVTTHDARFRLPGGTFTYVVDMVYIPLENAAKYSPDGAPGVCIHISEKAGRAAITISNPLPSDANLALLEDLAHELHVRVNESGASHAVRREGGSGYYKLGKLIHVNLPALQIEVVIAVDREHRTFNVTLLFSAEGGD